VQGVVVVDPAVAGQSEPAHPAIVEAVLVDGSGLDPRAPLELAPGAHRVEFRYTSLRLRGAERLEFAYRLEGLDPDWVPAGAQRQAHYTNLPAGRYAFRVRARSGDGAWSEAGAPVTLTLRPHWYRTATFNAALIALVALAIALVYRLRVRGLVRRERELKRRIDEAMADVKVLSGLLPICAHCKSIRDDAGYWNRIEAYILEHTEAEFTHGICPQCLEKIYPDVARRLKEQG
jgi:hypothetical protein